MSDVPATTREALVLLRQDAVTPAVEAKCAAIADSTRREFLVSRDWNFARSSAALGGRRAI